MCSRRKARRGRLKERVASLRADSVGFYPARIASTTGKVCNVYGYAREHSSIAWYLSATVLRRSEARVLAPRRARPADLLFVTYRLLSVHDVFASRTHPSKMFQRCFNG